MKFKLLMYRLNLRQTLQKATIEQLKITKEEATRELIKRSKSK